jgi:flagellum-specific peptidoglycan hydrolase FlgJ/peptidoglycan hydrolase-like protein with peptidoglycan-binding domain
LRYTTQQLRGLWRDFRCDESRMVVTEFGPTRVTVAKPTADAWLALAQVLGRHDYKIRDLDTGGYVCRKITGGNQPSLHSYGIAVDVNWQTNPYLKTSNRRPVRFSSATTQEQRALDVRHDRADTDMTQAMIDDVLEIVTNEGKTIFAWGGDFQTNKDCMHFQLDVSPKELAQGVDWTRLGRGEAELPEPGEPSAEESEAEAPEADKVLRETEQTFQERSDSMPGLTSEVIAAARSSDQKWGVPASVSLAQFILESNWGRSMPGGLSSNNPFGIKARQGEPSVAAQTHEFEHGATITMVARFRKFSSIAEAFDAHGALLATARVYAPVMLRKDDPDEFADALTGRYATDPQYGSKLRDLMRRNNLYQYDVPAMPVVLPSIFDFDLSGPPATTSDDDLKTGSSGVRVELLQKQLAKLGYEVGDIDGVFGSLTRAALAAFQVDNGLIGTGVADSSTRSALESAPPRPLDPQRTNATSKDVAAKGSVVINQAGNVKMAGWIANILGALGVINSAVANASGAGSTTPAANPLPADAATLVAALRKLAETPAVQKAAPGIKDIVAQATQVQTDVLAHAPAATHTILDLLPAFMQGGSVVQTLAPIVATLVPGFGGSLIAVGLGVAVQLFSNRIIDARTQDHRTAANVGR